MYGVIKSLVTLKRGVCMGLFKLLLHLRGVYVIGLFNPLLHLRGAHVWGYSTPCYIYQGCMFGDIQSFLTLKRNVCMELFNPCYT